MKKTVRLCFVLLAVLSLLTACASTPSATTQPTTAPAATAAPTATEAATAAPSAPASDIMTPEGKYPDTITISIPKSASADPRFAQGDTVDNNCLTRIILDKLNIKVNIAWEVEATEYVNKLSLNLASNSLPDAFTIDDRNNYLFYKQLVDNDMLADLTDAYAKCAGPYMKDTFNSYQEKNLAPFTENGKLMGIADGAYGYQHELLWVRQDWLKQYNLPNPKTLDDVKNITKTFIDNNAGGKGNVGLILDAQHPASTIDNSLYTAGPILESFGAFPKNWVKDSSGKVEWGSVAPEMKQGLQVLADWYKAGLIDKQFPTRTASGATDALIKDGQCGIFFAPWWETYVLFPDFPKNNPTGELMAYNAPLDANGNFNIMWPGPSNAVMLVNKNYAHPEAIVKMLNVEFDAWRGIDPDTAKLVQPSMDAGTDWVYLFPTGAVNLEYADCIPDVGGLCKSFVDTGVMQGKFGHTETAFNQSLATDAKKYADTKSLDNSGWIQYYGRYYASNIVDAPEVKITYPAFSFTTPSMEQLKPNLDKLEDETMLEIITGQKPVDYFDTFVSQWHAQGGDTITGEVQGMVK